MEYPLQAPLDTEEELRPLSDRITEDEERSIVSTILGVKERSETHYASRRNQWLDYFYHYINKKRTNTRSTIPVPLAPEHVDTAHASIMTRQFATRPFCSVRPRGLADRDAAPIIEDLLQYQYDQMGIFDIFYVMSKAALIFGFSPARICYERDYDIVPQQGGDTRVINYSGPMVYPFDPFDYFPDPSKIAVNDPAPAVVRMYRPYEFLEERADNFPNVFNDVHKIPSKREANIHSDHLNARQARQSELGMAYEDTGRGLIEMYEADIWWPEKKVNGEYIRRPYIFTIANGKLIRATRNHYVSQHGNMILGTIDSYLNELGGRGIIEKEHPNIHGANTVLDMILTNLEGAVRRKKIVNRNSVKNEHELLNGYGGVIHADGPPREAMAWEDVMMVAPDAYNVLGLFTTQSQGAGGSKPVMQGDVGQSTLATEIIEAKSQAGERFTLYQLVLEATIIKPMTEFMHKINQQFLDLPFVVPILESNISKWPVVDMQTIAANPNFIPEGSSREMNRQVNIAQIEKFLMIVSKIPGMEAIIPVFIKKLAQEFRWQEADEIGRLAEQSLQMFGLSSQQGAGAGGVPMNQIADHGNSGGVNATSGKELNDSMQGEFGPSSIS